MAKWFNKMNRWVSGGQSMDQLSTSGFSYMLTK